MKSVLIVEDDKNISSALRDKVADAGYNPFVADDLISVIMCDDADIVITDNYLYGIPYAEKVANHFEAVRGNSQMVYAFTAGPKELDESKFKSVMSKVDHSLNDVVDTIKGKELEKKGGILLIKSQGDIEKRAMSRYFNTLMSPLDIKIMGLTQYVEAFEDPLFIEDFSRLIVADGDLSYGGVNHVRSDDLNKMKQYYIDQGEKPDHHGYTASFKRNRSVADFINDVNKRMFVEYLPILNQKPLVTSFKVSINLMDYFKHLVE